MVNRVVGHIQASLLCCSPKNAVLSDARFVTGGKLAEATTLEVKLKWLTSFSLKKSCIALKVSHLFLADEKGNPVHDWEFRIQEGGHMPWVGKTWHAEAEGDGNVIEMDGFAMLTVVCT